jgi:ribonuclease P protein component
MSEKFRKAERLCSKKIIRQLFSSGKSYSAYPVKLLYLETSKDEKAPVKVLISVPKKNIRSAVKRNLIKRRIREAYRRNKKDLLETMKIKNKGVTLGFIYTAKQEILFSEIQNKIIQTLQRLKLEYEEPSQPVSDSFDKGI